MLHRFHHAAIAVRQLEPAVELYARLLGVSPAVAVVEGSARVAAFALANARIELHAPHGDAPALRDHLEQQGEGLYAIGFSTLDARAAAAALAERGLGPIPLAPRGPAARAGAPAPGGLRRIELRKGQVRGVQLRIVEEPDDAPPAGGDPCAAGAVGRLDHVVVRTPAVEDSIRLYRDQLGLRLALDRNFPERGVRLVFFRIAGVTVELAARLGGPADRSRPDAFGGLAYGVEDVAAARERVRAAGFDVSEVRTGNKPGTLVCTVHGPTHDVPTLLIGPEPTTAKPELH